MVYLQTDCLKTDVKYGTNRKEDVMFNGSMRVSQPHASKYYIKMSRSRKKFPAGVNCCCKSQKKGKKVASKRFRRKVKVLMHAVGANVSGQIASAIVGGLIIGLVL